MPEQEGGGGGAEGAEGNGEGEVEVEEIWVAEVDDAFAMLLSLGKECWCVELKVEPCLSML